VRPKSGYQSDWVGSFAVAGWNPGTQRITLGANPTGVIAIGDRVVGRWDIGGVSTSIEVTATGVGANWVDIDSNPGAVMTAASNITPGGPLWQPMRDAIGACFDSLGGWPSFDPLLPRYPAHDYTLTGWVYRSDLIAAVEAIPGVQAVTLTTPAADQVGTSNPAVAPGQTDGYTLNPFFAITWVAI
jgi:hypothetical protein